MPDPLLLAADDDFVIEERPPEREKPVPRRPGATMTKSAPPPPPPPEDEPPEPPEPARPKARKAAGPGIKAWLAAFWDSSPPMRKTLVRVITVVVVILIGVVLYLGFSSSPPPPELPPEPLPPPPKKEEPPPPKKVDPSKPEVAPPPRLVVVRVEPPFTAARFLLDRAANPAAFDAMYIDKQVTIHGVCGRAIPGVIELSDREVYEADPTGGIICTLQKKEKEEAAGPLMQSGRPVTIRGIYQPPVGATFGSRISLTDSEVVGTTCPGDDLYRDKEVLIAGLVRSVTVAEDGGLPTVSLERPTTTTPITVQGIFRASQAAEVAKLKPGQPVLLRGRCSGRIYKNVRLDNCSLVNPLGPPDTTVIAVTADRFCAIYEVDLLPAPRPTAETFAVPVTAEQLVTAFEADPKAAAGLYRFRPVRLTSPILSSTPSSRTVVFEVGTTHRLQVNAAFTATAFKAVRPDDTTLTIRGTCTGVHGTTIRIEDAEVVDPDATNPATHTVAEYLPFKPGRELLYDLLQPVNMPQPGGKPKEPVIQRWSLKCVEPDQIRSTLVRVGTFPGTTLFADPPVEPKWIKEKEPAKSKTPPPPPPMMVSRYRVRENTIEVAQPPAPGQAQPFWDPVLQIGLKKGNSWSADMPGGRIVQYTVVAFTKDDAGRNQLEIKRVVRNPENASRWEESAILYVHGLGEVRRTTTVRAAMGDPVVIAEMRLVPAELGEPGGKTDGKEPEKKDAKEAAPAPRKAPDSK